ncbi:MAG TPA: HPF/RaiA family ribosome-associated protein [Polyangiaceae bacterium]|nr:HPF/RaiA family ribosome-associated protein [Polyangiaceae bacterium]
MQIQVNSDNKIEAPERIAEHVREVVEKALKKVSDHVTRVEVHFTKENAHGADDIKCVMEARLERTQPTAVTHHAPSVHLATDGAAEKLQRALSHIIGKRRDAR